jgi:hypothetical protein
VKKSESSKTAPAKNNMEDSTKPKTVQGFLAGFSTKVDNNKRVKKYNFIEFFNLNSLLFKYKITKPNFEICNNISKVNIPQDILNILTLGSSFVLYKPHLGVSLDKLEIVYTNLMREIQSDNDIFITQLWKKYENKARKFYENRVNPSHKVIFKLELFLSSNNLIIKEADKNLGLTVMIRTGITNKSFFILVIRTSTKKKILIQIK